MRLGNWRVVSNFEKIGDSVEKGPFRTLNDIERRYKGEKSRSRK